MSDDKCNHDERFTGVMFLPKGTNGCLACAYEKLNDENADLRRQLAEARKDSMRNEEKVVAKQKRLCELHTQLAEAQQSEKQATLQVGALAQKVVELREVMVAAAEEINEHWEAHCNKDGYGPANLVHRLEKAIATNYPGYSVGEFQRLRRQLAIETRAKELATKQCIERIGEVQDLRRQLEEATNYAISEASKLREQLAEAQELLIECEKWPVWAKETDHLTWIAKVRAFIAAQAPQSSPDEPD